MELTTDQVNNLYDTLIFQIKLRIINDFETITNFSKKSGINRTSLEKVLSDNNAQNMSVGTYLRICIALGIISGTCSATRNTNNGYSLKEYLSINNNQVFATITIINNNL